MTDVPKKGEDGGSNWLWWTAGIFLFLAYCNYSERDHRSEPGDATVSMSYAQASAYQDCMETSRWYGSDHERSGMCQRSALGLDDSLDCHTEYDGRANPTVCD